MKPNEIPGSDDLAMLRADVEKLDTEIVKLLNNRAKLALKIKEAKKNASVYVPSRESQVIKNLLVENPGPLPDIALQSIYKEIIGACRNLQQMLRVSYLGPKGTYSEEAAIKYFGSTTQLVPCETVTEALRETEGGNADVVVLPIENSTEGAVIDTHKLLLETSLQIIGEVYIPIRHCLLSTAQELQAITRVYGHPQALGQCRNWLQNNTSHAALISTLSNGEAARLAKEKQGTAAVASKQAAIEYGLNIIAQSINDQPTNTTRFIMLGKVTTSPTKSDKTSFVCTLPDKPGVLYEILGVMAKQEVSMSRLESQRYATGEYAFYIDIIGHKENTKVDKVLQSIKGKSKLFKILGSYPADRKTTA